MQFRRIQWFVLVTMFVHLLNSMIQGFFVESIFVQVYLSQAIFLVFGLLILVRQRKNIVEYAKLKLPPWWSFLVVIPIVMATILLSSFVTAFSMLFTRAIGLIDIPQQELAGLTSSNLLLVLTFSLLPGIVEEFYCRGVLLPSYEQSMSTKSAILLSSLMFGLMHFNLWNILSPMVLGIVFSLLTIRFQSIIPAMFGHALYNLLVLGAQKIQVTSEIVVNESDITWGELVSTIPSTAVAAAFIGWLFWRLGIKQYFKPADQKKQLIDHIPTLAILLLFVGITYLIQKGLGL